jgi:hypothetical protein
MGESADVDLYLGREATADRAARRSAVGVALNRFRHRYRRPPALLANPPNSARTGW